MGAGEQMTAMDRRRELLRQRVAESGIDRPGMQTAQAARPGERRGLCPGQQRMWFLQNKDPADTTLNICVAHRMTGALHEQRLREAFATLVERHDILRTTYGVDESGQPYQVVHDHAAGHPAGDLEFAWSAVDLRSEPDPGDALAELATREFGRPFDLTVQAPLRMVLARIADDEHVLLLVLHHICWDDNCWEVFFTELNEHYAGRRPSGDVAQFSAVGPGPDSSGPAALEYWREQLTPIPEPVALAGPAPVNMRRAARRRRRTLSARLMTQVEEIARERAATPFMVLFAAFGVLIRRYAPASPDSDLLVAVPVTERKAHSEKTIGYFGNTLLLRVAPAPSQTFETYLAAVREVCLAGLGHQEVGIDRVVREVAPARAAGRDGMEELVQVGFSMRRDVNGYDLPGVWTREIEIGEHAAQLPLSLVVATDSDGVVAEIEYQIDVVPDWIVDQMLAHYEHLLADCIGHPEKPLWQLELFGAEQCAKILANSHGPLVDEGVGTLLPILDAGYARTPDAIAVVSDDVQLTYAELYRRSNRLARWFAGQGIGAEDVVGLKMTTSVEFIVAVVAVLKSGAAYLPIDPALPQERVEYLMSDVRPRIVLDAAGFAEAERHCAGLPEAACSDADRVRPLRPENLAYIIYTSGSTGRPKGVAVDHRGIAEHAMSFSTEWNATDQDRMLQSASVSFDASIGDIMCALALGARLVVPKPNPYADLAYLADFVHRHGVSVMHMVPSTLETVMQMAEVAELQGIRQMAVGGEALSGEVADRFLTLFDAELRNHYGPTEAVVCSTHMMVDGACGVSVLPIGRPGRNVYAYVLDGSLSPLPPGVAGELYLGGVQLARGYHGRPALTAERFVPDPFSSGSRPGARLYRTGDLVRYNDAGALEFLGRVDEQVKIRGYRIELGEVQAVIAAHPAVAHCVVTVFEDSRVGPTLAAYVVPSSGSDAEGPDTDELRRHAEKVLPPYMVPGVFVVIPGIPLTTSGKLDKRALPAPEPMAERPYREPATAAERRMCAIFGQLFGRDRIGVADSFFELGGHSLLAARLVALIRAEFGVELTVRVVFDSPTPEELAAHLVAYFRDEMGIDLDDLDLDDLDLDDLDDSASDELEAVVRAASGGRPTLARSTRPERIPLSFSQAAMWFEYQMADSGSLLNMPFVLHIDGPLDADSMHAALNDVVARQAALRIRFGMDNGVPYQTVEPPFDLSLPILHVAADELDQTWDRLRADRFALESGPLVRAALLRVNPREHVLVLVVDHIVADHSSFGVILNDLMVAYRARLGGHRPDWKPLAVEFPDYVLWHRQAFGSASTFAESELAHWRSVLSGIPDQISVAHDRVRPPVLGKSSQMQTFTLAPPDRSALVRFAENAAVTEFMVYQAALSVVLHRLGGGDDIVMGSPIACRVDPSVVDLVGLLANMVVLRNDFADDPSLRTVLSRSRDTILNAQAHQELPFERLVEGLNPQRSRAFNPVFQTMVSFQGPDWSVSHYDLTGNGQTTVSGIQTRGEVSYVDLNFRLIVNPAGGLDVTVAANADLYLPQTAQLIAQAFEAACRAFASSGDVRVSQLELLPQQIMERLLAPPATFEEPDTVVELPSVGSPETVGALIAALEELLEIDGVVEQDNFFALGGDSVISIQWSARMAERGLILTPQMVFEHMTIAALAAAVDWATQNPPAQEDSIQPVASADSVDQQSAPMSASGLNADTLAALTASWQAES